MNERKPQKPFFDSKRETDESKVIGNDNWYQKLSDEEFAQLISELILGIYDNRELKSLVNDFLKVGFDRELFLAAFINLRRYQYFYGDGVSKLYQDTPSILYQKNNFINFIVAFILTAKALEDVYFKFKISSNENVEEIGELKAYSEFTGISTQELKEKEIKFLKRINYQVFLGTEAEMPEFNKMKKFVKQMWEHSKQQKNQDNPLKRKLDSDYDGPPPKKPRA